MTTRVLSDDQIKKMLGPMHSAYLDAVKANEQRRSELDLELASAKAEVILLTEQLVKANRLTDSLAALVAAMQARLRKRSYHPTDNEGSEP